MTRNSLFCADILLAISLNNSLLPTARTLDIKAQIFTSFLAHSKNELMQWRVVRRLSVRPSVRL